MTEHLPTLWTVSTQCGCLILRTMDEAEAVEYVNARPADVLILDAISGRYRDLVHAAEDRVVGCICG